MKTIRESVFDDIYSSEKDEVKNVVPELNMSKLIYEDEDTLIIKIGSAEDFNKLPKLDTISEREWNDSTAYDTGQPYAIYDFENKESTAGIATVYANGKIDIPYNMKNFSHKHLLKGVSIEDLTLLPLKNIDAAHNTNKIDLNTFDFDHIKDLISEHPILIRGINIELLSEAELIELSDINKDIYKYLPKEAVLALKKAKLNPEQKAKLEDEDMYAFLAKDKFIETKDGMYKKDLEIESLNKIDQFSKEGQYSLSMLNIRARFQQDVKLFYIWTRKDLFEDVLDDKMWRINEPEFEWLRQSIRSKAVPANKVKNQDI